MSSPPNQVLDRDTVVATVRGMLQTLTASLGTDASGLGEDDIIPDTGVLDSAGIIELIVMIDTTYGLDLEAEDMTIDNLGSLSAIAAFVAARGRG